MKTSTSFNSMKAIVRLASVLCVLFWGVGNAWGIELYKETFGDNGSCNSCATAVASASCYTASTTSFTTGHQTTVVENYSSEDGTKVSKNNASSSANSGASGLSNIYRTGAASQTDKDFFTIKNINISGYSSLSLKFNLFFGGGIGAGKVNTITVKYKIDSGTETTLTYTGAPTSNSSWSWCTGDISGTGNSLQIKFYQTTNGGYLTRIDDIILFGTAAASCSTNATVEAASSNGAVTSTSIPVQCASGISNIGGAGCSLTDYGFVWKTTSAAPNISTDTKQSLGSSIAASTAFNYTITGLTPNTKYYVYAYATNGHGTGYSSAYEVTTLQRYTISYNNNGGSSSMGGSTKDHGVAFALPANAGSMTKTGHHIIGWLLNSGSGTHYDLGGSYTTNANATFYAEWTANTYQVAFNANGGSGSMSNETGFTYGESKALTTCSFTAPTDKYFIGWNTDSGASSALYTDGQSVSNLTATDNGTVTLYAIWKDHTYTNYRTSCCTAPGTALSITSANSVATGGTVSLTSTGGNGGTVTWSVVNGTGSATIEGTTLTAGTVGTITVKAHQDATGSYCEQDAEQAFTVVSSTVNVTGVTVAPTTKAIIPGETFTITPTISPSNATDKSVSWSSSASDKASVSSGTVTGVAAGTATITCTTTDGSKTATTAVTVYAVTMQVTDEDGNAIGAGGPGAPSRTGASISPAADAGNYVFKEWAISGASLGSSASTKANTITNPTGAVTVTAKYYKPRTVKWSVNGNDSYTAGGATTSVAYNGTISTVPTDPSGLACASTFVAWTDATHNNGQTAKDDDSYYGSALYTAAGDFPNITAETTTFYAVFAERSNSDGYKYIGDDGTLSDGEKYIFIDSKTAGSAHALKASDLPLNNAAGKRGTAVSVTITTTAEGTLITTINTNLEFTYASTGTKLVISGSNYLYVNGNGVGYKESSSRSTYGTHTLYGWTDKSSNRYVYYDSSNGYFTVSEDSKNMYAFKKQTPEYSNYVTECDANIVKVTYDANGGATSCTNTTTDKTEDFTVCSSAPTRDYYTFAGWLCSADDEVYAANATIDDAVIDADFTLTAQWTPVPYNITYELDGGTNNVGNPATYNVTTATITLQDPTKGHDRFDGWYKTYSAGVYSNPVTSIPLGSHGDITLYAKWSARHEIIFDADGVTTTIYRADDEALNASVAGQGSIPANPSAPSACSSKVFVGWVAEEIDGETDDEPTFLDVTSKVNADKHYYAVWATSVGNSIAAVEDESFTGGEYTTYFAKPYGLRSNDKYVYKNSIWTSSDMTAGTKVKIKVKHLSNSSAATLTIALINSSGTVVTSTTLSTTANSNNIDNAAYSSNVELIATTAVTGYQITLSNIGSSSGVVILAATREVVATRSAYSTSCCATKVTLTQNDPEHGTVTFNKTTQATCGGDKEVTMTITPAAGYQLSSYAVATGDGKVAAKSMSAEVVTNNNSSAAQNITLTFAEDANGAYDVTASFSLMTVTSWTWTLNSAAIPDPLNLYVGQSARLDVAYTPAGVDASKKTYERNKDNAYINWVGAQQTTYSTISGRATTGENTAAVTFTHADGPSTTVNVKVLPLPLVHFTDNVHNVVFADVAGTLEANALVKDKTTPTTSDFSGTTYNTCEEQHEHLVGWIESSWADEHPNATHSEIAGAGEGVFYTAGASIDVDAQNGKTFYAVWSKIE